MNEGVLIPIMVLAPLVGGLLLTTLPRGRDGAVRGMALGWSVLTLVLSLMLGAAVGWRRDHFGAISSLPWIKELDISFGFGLDSISLWLVLLTTFLMPIVILGSWTAVKERTREFFVWLLVLETAMLGTFVATDLIFFYICFEFTLVPMYFLIGIYGGTQRLKAARVFFLYTFTGSMLTLAGVLYVAWFNARHTGEWSFYIPQLYEAARAMSLPQQTWVLLALLAGFAVKVPLFPVHTWLPLAHTEAPTAGSVVLAGVLLKLGTYGLLRFALPMTPDAAAEYAPCIAVLAVVGILYAALICWVQKDIKKLIAYSSVSHLGFCVLGMFALNPIGVQGSVLYMVNHGLSTGALFLCVGMIYERFHTREMAAISGLARVMPVWAFFMVFFCLASVGLPGLNGFVSEFLALLGAFRAPRLGPVYAAVAGVGMIFGAIYVLYMVGRVVWGPLKVPAEAPHGHAGHEGANAHASPEAPQVHAGLRARVRDLTWREVAVLTPLALGCLWLGVYPKPVMRSLDGAIANVIAPAHAEAARYAGAVPPRREIIPAADRLEVHATGGDVARRQAASRARTPAAANVRAGLPEAAPPRPDAEGGR